jgi:hypothetical protein
MDDDQRKSLYLSLLEEERRIENRAFATLGNFLTANAFVFVAWANFYRLDGSGFGGIDWVLTLLAIAGYVGGLAWALLGARNWEYARRIVGELILVGGEYRPGRESLYSTMRGVEEAVHASWKGKLKLGALSYHATILAGTPLVVALLYVAMLTTLLWVRQASPFGCAPWFLPAATVTIGLVLVGIVNVRCSGSIKAAEKAVEDARKQFPAKAA